MGKMLFLVPVIVLLAVYLVFDPATHPFFPRCPFLGCTGLYCPGCGSQRALHQLCNGHMVRAAGFNLLAVLFLPLIVVYYVSGLFKAGRNRVHLAVVHLVNRKWFIYSCLGLVVLFGIIRNTPMALGRYLAP